MSSINTSEDLDNKMANSEENKETEDCHEQDKQINQTEDSETKLPGDCFNNNKINQSENTNTLKNKSETNNSSDFEETNSGPKLENNGGENETQKSSDSNIPLTKLDTELDDRSSSTEVVTCANEPTATGYINAAQSFQTKVHDLRMRARARVKMRVQFVKDKIDQYYDTLPWVIGALSRLLGIQFAPIKIPMERRLQTFAMMWWMSCFLVLGLGSWVLFYQLFFYTQYWWIVLCYLCWFAADMDVSSRGGRRSRWMRNWKIWNYKRDFFPAHLIKTVDIPADKNYIMGFHPHGIIAAGGFCNFATEATGFSTKFPGLTVSLVTLKMNFLVPLYRDYILMTGAIDSSKESIEYKLSEKSRGTAVVIVLGGAREALDCHPGSATLTLKNRKGFCKIALRKGASLVPIYSFGENEVYDQVHNPPGSWTRRIQELLLKYCGVAPCLFFGRGMLQYSFGLIPYRRPMYTVVGAPIPVTKVDNPTREQVEALHRQYVEALVQLYDDHKEKYAMDPSVPIIIR